jgi:hypothetical protein
MHPGSLARNQAIRPAHIGQRRPVGCPASTGATPTGAPAARSRPGGNPGSAAADRPPPPAHRTPNDIDQERRHIRRSMHPGRWPEIGRFAWHASASVDSPAVRRRPVRRPTGAPPDRRDAQPARRPTGATRNRRAGGATPNRRTRGRSRAGGSTGARRWPGPATAAGSPHRPRRRSRTSAYTTVDAPWPPARNQAIRPARIGQRRPVSCPAPTGATRSRRTGGPIQVGRLTGGSAAADRPPPPTHHTPTTSIKDFGMHHGRCTPDRQPEIRRFARHASANVDPPTAPHRPARHPTGTPATRSRPGGSTGGSAAADRPPPPRSPHPNDIDQGLRHAPRSMHPDRQPEIRRFARHTSANVDPPATPTRQTSDHHRRPE